MEEFSQWEVDSSMQTLVELRFNYWVKEGQLEMLISTDIIDANTTYGLMKLCCSQDQLLKKPKHLDLYYNTACYVYQAIILRFSQMV